MSKIDYTDMAHQTLAGWTIQNGEELIRELVVSFEYVAEEAAKAEREAIAVHLKNARIGSQLAAAIRARGTK
jgi:hypothetical protein